MKKILLLSSLLFASLGLFGADTFIGNVPSANSVDPLDKVLLVTKDGKTRLGNVSSITALVPPATAVYPASQPEVTTGTDNTKFVTPLTLRGYQFNASQLDNNTYLGFLSLNYGSTLSMNRYGTSNTFYKINNKQPFTVLFIGDGLVDEPQTNSMFQSVCQGLINSFGLAGRICNLPPGYAMGLFEPISMTYYGANCSFGKNADWNWGIYLTNDGAGIQVTMPADVNADILGIGYVSQSLGGNMVLSTNNVTMKTLAGYSATRAGNWLWWTNFSRQASSTIKVLNSGAGINAVFAVAAIDSTSSGVIVGRQSTQSSSVSSYRNCAESVRSPVYKAWNPTLIIADWFAYTNNPTMLSDYATTLYFYKTNTTTTDVIVSSSFNCPASYNFDVPNMMYVARTNGQCYFDGWGVMHDFTTMFQRGIIDSSQAHLTSDGYAFYGSSLWNWMGLMEKH